MTVDNLLTRLDRVKKTGRSEWVACCPAHKSRSRQSLAISEAANGRVLIHDFGGCSPAEVLRAIGLDFTVLFPERDPDEGGWRTASHRNARHAAAHVSARTALVAVAHDATEAAVLVADVAENKVLVADARPRLFELAGRIASALEVAGAYRGSR